MDFIVLTLFPDMIRDGLHTSITGRAMEDDIIRLQAVNIRDYTNSKHGKTDDYPYGGGAGMVMQAQPVYDAYQAVAATLDYKPRVVYLTPQGKVFNQSMAKELAVEQGIVFLCGHYEGVDERVLEEIVTDNISIGDFVLTGGELPAMCMIDAISRMIPGVLHNEESAEGDSLSDGLLEYPQYSRPEVWNGKAVPKILLSGDHAKVDLWRREQSLIRTAERRPDLLENAAISPKEREFIRKYLANRDGL
jgi:tRNA (guanine37-N1)-methyltransferase